MSRAFTYAIRSLRRAPGFSLTALLLICLSVGGVTTIATAVYSALARPLRGTNPVEGLVWLTMSSPRIARPQGLSYPDYRDYCEAGRSVLTGCAAYEPLPVSLASGPSSAGPQDPARLTEHLVFGSYFALLGVRASVGRLFDDAELQPGADFAVVVIGHDVWRSRFGSDPSIVGSAVSVNGRPFTVVGVAAPGFAGPELGVAADAWLPAGAARIASSARAAAFLRRDRPALTMIASLAQGVSPDIAQQALAHTSKRLSAEFPDSHDGLSVRVSRAHGGLPPGSLGEAVPMATLLVGLAGLVLAIAYTNLAGVQLARELQRSRDTAIHLALGAGRARLFQQVLAESIVLAGGGGLLGALLSIWVADLVAIGGAEFRGLTATPGVWTLGAAMALAVTTGVAFGVGPAWITARRDVIEVLKESSATATRGGRRLRLQSVCVVAQLAMSLVLLFAATQFVRSIHDANSRELGFEPDGVATLSFDLALQNYGDERQTLFERDLLARIAALPGVSVASLVNAPPTSGVIAIDDGVPADNPSALARPLGINGVSPGFFQTLRIPIRLGRPFSDADRQGAPLVAILNETAARQLWPGKDPVGRFVRVGTMADPAEVIGVAADAKYDDPTEDPMPFAYFPLAQRRVIERTSLLVRSASGIPLSAQVLGAVVHGLDPALPVFDGTTMRNVVRMRLDRQSAIGGLLSLVGVGGMLIAAVGLYGVLAYTVTQRKREIGIRMALGATPRQVLGLIVARSLKLTAVAICVGAAGALPVALLLSRQVFGLRAGDVGSFLAASLMLAGIAAMAALLPGRRAATIHPLDALRLD